MIGVAVVEVVDAVDAGDVGQHAPGHERADVLDAEPGRAALVDDRGVDAVVEPALVADVGQRVPVGGGLHAHGQRRRRWRRSRSGSPV